MVIRFLSVNGPRYLLFAALIVCLLGMVFAPSLPLNWTNSNYDDRRVLQMATLVVASLMLLLSRPQQHLQQPRPDGVVLLLVLVFLLGLASAWRAPVAEYALLEVSLFAVSLYVIWRAREAPFDWLGRLALFALVLSALLYVFVLLLRVISIRQDMGAGEISPYLAHSFINIRYFNQWLSWLLPLLPAALYLSVPRCRRVLWRGAVLLLMALLWAALWHTEGRGTLYALIGCAVLLPLLFGRLAGRWLGWQAVAALAGVVLSVIWLGADWPFFGEQARKIWSASDAGRLRLWGLSWQLFIDHPYLGVGPMHFAALHFDGPGHPHSAVMQILAEWGALAFILLMAALIWMAVRWLRALRRWKSANRVPTLERMLVVGITASILTAGAHSLVSSVLVTPVSLLMLVVVFSLAASWYHHRQWGEGSVAPSADRLTRPQRMLAMLPVLVTCFYLGVVGMKETLNHSYIWEIGFQSDLGPYSPRFWHQGSLLYRLDEPWLSFSHSGEPREHPARRVPSRPE